MENAMELGAIWDFPEDDVFYEELRRQVLILTAEDDEECHEKENRSVAKSQQGRFNRVNPVYFYNWSGNDAMENSVQRWPVNSGQRWPGNGTGVFIPQTSKGRRRNKPRKKGNENGRNAA